MARATKTADAAPVEGELVRRVARVLFQIDEGGANSVADKDARRTLWEATQGDHRQRARRLMKQMERQGLAVVATAPPGEGEA